MKEYVGKKFIASYSGGKDCVLATHRAINSGLLPHKLITTYNTDLQRSWFHGIPTNILNQVSDSLSIPIQLIKTSGEEYESNFEKALIEAKNEGAEVCVFGDIDIEGHLEWCSARCEKVGLTPYFPLWKEDRKKLVYEFINSGFSAMITTVDTTRLSDSFLGKTLSLDLVDAIEKSGADICGENGEYHTFVFGGPIFTKKIDICINEKILRGNYASLPIFLR